MDEARRYASFIGTSNVTDLLTDPTGSRRFLCVELKAPIDTETPIEYDQLYAQILQELEEGKPYWFTEEEVEQIMESNQQFMHVELTEQLFKEYFRKPMEDQEGEWMSPTEILRRVKLQRGDLDMSVERFGRYLKNMTSLPCRRGKRSMQYKVVLAA